MTALAATKWAVGVPILLPWNEALVQWSGGKIGGTADR